MADPQLTDYYRLRAPAYEALYDKPERQADLSAMVAWLRAELAGHDVLDLACGTGWWTERYAAQVRSVLGLDINPEVLAIARAKGLDPQRVRFREGDAARLALPEDISDWRPTAVFAGFWWSHLRRAEIAGFLADLRALTGPDVRVILIDNRYVPGSSTPIAETDAQGDTWQRRPLADGSTHRVLKNFPDDEQLRDALGQALSGITLTHWHHYWAACGLTSRRCAPASRPSQPATHGTGDPS